MIDWDRRDVVRDHLGKSIEMRKSKLKADVIDDICGCSALSSIIHRKDLNSTSGKIANIFTLFSFSKVIFKLPMRVCNIKYVIYFYSVRVVGYVHCKI